MILTHRTVKTLQLPEMLTMKEERRFLVELLSHMKENRPQIVIDCSRVRSFDKCVVRLLLHALEHALKRKGDVRLADVSSEGCAVLQETGADRLFEVYTTVAEATQSYHQIPALAMLGYSTANAMQPAPESAA